MDHGSSPNLQGTINNKQRHIQKKKTIQIILVGSEIWCKGGTNGNESTTTTTVITIISANACTSIRVHLDPWPHSYWHTRSPLWNSPTFRGSKVTTVEFWSIIILMWDTAWTARLIHWGRMTARVENDRHFATIFKCIFYENIWNSNQTSLKYISKCAINYKPAFVQIMHCLQEATSHYLNQMVTYLQSHICATRL